METNPDLAGSANSILQSARLLGEHCNVEQGHTQQVTRLALRLFDELHEVHQMDPADRLRLECAALLHDIGWLEGRKGHHRAALRIILETPLLALDSKERLIIGSIARYHRKSLPSQAHDHFAALETHDQDTVSKLAALLRLADGLDYDHLGRVLELACKIRPRKVVLRVTATQFTRDEQRDALKKGDLFELVFQRKLDMDWSPPL